MSSAYDDKWYVNTWRPAVAWTYLCFCIIDYGVRPAINYYEYKKFNLTETVNALKELPSTSQVQIIQALQKPDIPPVLNEFVHLAFGSIIGVSAWTRGMEKIETIRNQPEPPPQPEPQPQDRRKPKRKKEEVIDDGSAPTDER
jgi:hypothetical protein